MIDMSSPRTAVALAEIRAGLARIDATQQDLATRLSVSRTKLYRRLRGFIPFTVDELVIVADFIGVSLDTLIDQTPAGSDISSEPAGVSSSVV